MIYKIEMFDTGREESVLDATVVDDFTDEIEEKFRGAVSFEKDLDKENVIIEVKLYEITPGAINNFDEFAKDIASSRKELLSFNISEDHAVNVYGNLYNMIRSMAPYNSQEISV